MRFRLAWILLAACLFAGCTDRAEAVRAAQPHMDQFDHLRVRALKLLEHRSDVEQKRLLLQALHGDEESLPENLRPVLEQMRAQNVQLTETQLADGEAMFWRMLDRAFSEDPEILQAEIVFLEKDGAISRFRHPREREIPAGVKWFGLRPERTFAGLANCVTDDGSDPCVLIQLRPRDYSGSAGLTVGFRRAERP